MKKRWLKTICIFLITLLLGNIITPLTTHASMSSDNGDGTFSNPILYADVPDVDIIRVDDTYYMSSTTMHMSPGVPIMKSKDLVNWKIVNYVYGILDDGDAMSLRNDQSAYGKGSWASSLAYHDGKYYVVFASYTTNKTYVYVTEDIENGVWQHTEFNGVYHDMSLYFEDDGRIYMAYGSGSIRIVEMESVENGLLIKEGTDRVLIDDIWKNSELEGDNSFLYGEGTHLQKINGKYYVFIISWPPENETEGTKGIRTQLCFRADSIDDFTNGNWERKIILNDKGAAQGELIDTQDGTWYGMVFRDMGPVGRCPVLVPVTWTDGWPMLGNENGEVDDTIEMPIESQGESSIVTSDEFNNDAERPAYTYQTALENEAAEDKLAEPSLINEAAPVSEVNTVLSSASNVALGQEIIHNGNFDSGLEGWTENEDAALEITEENGNSIAKITERINTSSSLRQDITGSIIEGATYRISAKVKYDAETAPDNKQFNLCIFNGTSYVDVNSIQVMASTTAEKGSWATIEGTFTIAEGTDVSASAIFIETAWTASPSPEKDLFDFYVDDVSIIAESIPSVDDNNLIKNGTFENDLNDWEARECELILDENEKANGNSSVKVTERISTGGGPQQDISGRFSEDDVLEISYKIKYTTGPESKRFILTVYDGTTFTNLLGGDAKKGEWTEISGTYTVPESMNTQNLKVFIESEWTADQDPENDLMDYFVDDLCITQKIVESAKEGENDYNGSNLRLEWQWNHNPDNTSWSLTDREGYLRLTTGSISTDLMDARNTLTQRTYAPECSAYVALEVGNMKNGDVTGFSAFASKYGYIGVKMIDGQKYLVMTGTNLEGSDTVIPYEAESVKLEQDKVYLKIDFDFKNTNKAYFYYSLDGEEWIQLGDDLELVYGLEHFMGYRYGLFNYATENTGGYVDFDFFRIDDDTSQTPDPGFSLTKPYKEIGNVNPVVTQRYVADPGAMEYNGRVYVYGSDDTPLVNENGEIIKQDFAEIKNINLISSDDMVNWTDHGSIPIAGENGICKWTNISWAPAAAHKTIDGKEKFFLYFVTDGMQVGVVTSDSPTGPWTDPLGGPLITYNTPGTEDAVNRFDPAVMTDDDGNAYLAFGCHTMYVIKLSDDMIHTEGSAVSINAPQAFESSGLHKHNGKYYYTYCSTWVEEDENHNELKDENGNTIGLTRTDEHPGACEIGYMVANNPMGPYEYKGVILKQPGTVFNLWGNNHQSIFELNGKSYIVYHTLLLKDAMEEDMTFAENTEDYISQCGYRSTSINELIYNEDGTIQEVDMNLEGPEQIKNVNPFERYEAETMANNGGIAVENSDADGVIVPGTDVIGTNMHVTNIQNGDWIEIAGVDFGTDGATKFYSNIKSTSTGSKIELRIDDPEKGEVIGTLNVEAADSSQQWQLHTAEIDPALASGTHDLYLIFIGENNELFDIDYWQFEKTSSEEPTLTELKITDPTKTEYLQGEKLDLSGLVVTAIYSDGSEVELQDGDYTVSGYDPNTIGKQTVTITYEDKTATFTVTVSEAEEPLPTLDKIEITSPEKTEYTQGEKLDLSGLVVTAIYSDGSEVELQDGDYTVSGYDPNTIGKQTVTITYEDKTATFTVTVSEAEEPLPTLDKIEITSPEKTEYTQGEKLDLSGLVVTAIYSDGSEVQLQDNDYTVSGYDPNAIGEQTVTVTYGGKTATFTIIVTENKQPTDPSAPTTPDQTPDTQDEDKTNTAVQTGDNTNLFLPAAGILLAASLFFVTCKKKKTEI